MRRECRRQHGIIRNYRILPPPLNPRLTSPLTSGLFTKMPSKPIKVHWLRSNDIASSSNCKLLVVTGSEPGSVSNQSETGIDEGGGGEAEIETVKKIENDEGNREKEDDGSMSFYDVGMMMVEHVLDEDVEVEEEEDGWCLV